MVPEKAYPFLADLLSPLWNRHRKTLGLVIAAIAATGQARSFAIATTLARWLKIRLDSAVNRFYRLLRNSRVDYLELATQWAGLLAQAFNRLPSRSQNSRENTFLRLLAEAIRNAGAKAIILCDRGLRRVSWVELLQQLRLGFVVRLMDDVQVELEPGTKVALGQVLLRQGRVLDLGVVALRSDGKVRVRIVGYWAAGAHEPWWLATSEDGPAKRVLQLYDRRMTVEEQFRDTKGRRFGIKLFWTQFRDPEALSRFVMLLAIALLIWMLAGLRAARRDPSLLLRHKSKGPRQSYVTVGLRILTLQARAPRTTAGSIGRYLEPPTLRQLGKLSPGGK